jgi:hypothetical protein
MQKLITLLPTAYNDGRKVESQVFQNFETEVLNLVGGFSIEGLVEGGWKDDEGVFYRDRSRKYVVIADETHIDDLKALVIKYGKVLDQKAMYIEVQPAMVDFVQIA